MFLRLSPLILGLFAFASAQKLIYFNTLKGGDFENQIDVPLPFSVYVSAQGDDTNKLRNIFVKTMDNQIVSMDDMRNRKKTQGSGLLTPLVATTKAVITTTQPDNLLKSLQGFIYITTSKQSQDPNFLVYDVDQSQKISLDRNFLPNSTLVFLNTNRQTTPVQSSTVSAWTQPYDGTVMLYRGWPTDVQELESSQIFSNPVSTTFPGKKQWQYLPSVEKFSLSLGVFYFKTTQDLSFVIEPSYFNLDNSQTSQYSTTGFMHKPINVIDKKTAIRVLRDVNFNGTTGSNVVGMALVNTSSVTVQTNEYPTGNSISVTPLSLIQGFSFRTIGQNITISSVDMNGGEYFVQYYIIQDQRIVNETSTTPASPQTTTRSASGLEYFLGMIVMIMALSIGITG